MTLSASEALALRDDRLSKMDSAELPVTLFDAPRVILHLVPSSAFEAGSHADDLAKAVKPLFDAIWNAAGYAQSKNFSRDGEWLGT